MREVKKPDSLLRRVVSSPRTTVACALFAAGSLIGANAVTTSELDKSLVALIGDTFSGPEPLKDVQKPLGDITALQRKLTAAALETTTLIDEDTQGVCTAAMVAGRFITAHHCLQKANSGSGFKSMIVAPRNALEPIAVTENRAAFEPSWDVAMVEVNSPSGVQLPELDIKGVDTEPERGTRFVMPIDGAESPDATITLTYLGTREYVPGELRYMLAVDPQNDPKLIDLGCVEGESGTVSSSTDNHLAVVTSYVTGFDDPTNKAILGRWLGADLSDVPQLCMASPLNPDRLAELATAVDEG